MNPTVSNRKTSNHPIEKLSSYSSGGMVGDPGNSPGIECKGERPVIETMIITANRLEDVERKLGTIHNHLFGLEPKDDGPTESTEPNVRSLASCAFSSSVRLERMCEKIYYRLANN